MLVDFQTYLTATLSNKLEISNNIAVKDLITDVSLHCRASCEVLVIF